MSKEEEEYLYFLCRTCKKNSKLKVIAKYKATDTDHDGTPLYNILYYFCACEFCSFVSLIEEDPLLAASPLDSSPKFAIYPVEKRYLNFSLPELVKQSFDEAVGCERGGLHLATVVFVGRALEAAIADISEKQTSFFEGLRELKEKGSISKEIFEWGNELRVLRNIGAHPTKETVTSADAREAMDFLQAILEIFYHLRPKFKLMKQRRATEALKDDPAD